MHLPNQICNGDRVVAAPTTNCKVPFPRRSSLCLEIDRPLALGFHVLLLKVQTGQRKSSMPFAKRVATV